MHFENNQIFFFLKKIGGPESVWSSLSSNWNHKGWEWAGPGRGPLIRFGNEAWARSHLTRATGIQAFDAYSIQWVWVGPFIAAGPERHGLDYVRAKWKAAGAGRRLHTCPGSTRSEHKETTPASGEEGWWSRGALGTLIVPGFRAGLHTEAQKLTGTTLNRGNEYRRSVSWLGPAWEGWEVCGTT